MEERKIIELTIDDVNIMDGVVGVAVTETPAIEKGFMRFKKVTNSKFVAFANDEKHTITGAAMIPNQEIVRYTEAGEEYFVFFSENTIKSIVEKFFENGNQKNINLEHLNEIEGNVIYESWIIEDSTNDKAVALGFSDLPKGTWMISMKINNMKFWDKIKTMGEGSGFSIEGWFQEKEIQN